MLQLTADYQCHQNSKLVSTCINLVSQSIPHSTCNMVSTPNWLILHAYTSESGNDKKKIDSVLASNTITTLNIPNTYIKIGEGIQICVCALRHIVQ